LFAGLLVTEAAAYAEVFRTLNEVQTATVAALMAVLGAATVATIRSLWLLVR
jgi:hypothetical protein